MRKLSLEAAWKAAAELRNAEVVALLPNAEISASTAMLGGGIESAGEEIAITVVSATVDDSAAPAIRAALEAYMLAHSAEARHVCVRSRHGGD